MALYKLNESSDVLFESMDFILENTDDFKDRLEENLLEVEDKIKHYEAELRNTINSKPRSWLERKLVEFKVKLRKFELKHKLTKSNKSKSILQKIVSILTRIVKFINDKLLKFTRYVTNKFGKSDEGDRASERVHRTNMIRLHRDRIKKYEAYRDSYKKDIDEWTKYKTQN
jgi:hypothetical protein